MKIKNVWSLAALVSVAVAVTACSGNPTGAKNVVPKTAVAVKKTVARVAKKSARKAPAKLVVASARSKQVVAKKAIVKKTLAKRVVAKKIATPVKRTARVLKAKTLTQAQSRAKKRSMVALSKSRREQARVEYARSQYRKKYDNNQRLKDIAVAKNRAIAQNRVNRRIANLAQMNSLGLDRFTGSQLDVAVPKRVARKVVRRTVKRVVTRSKQSVQTRAKQPVRARAKQPVRSRAKQPVRARAQQPVRTRAKQVARTRARQPVRPRAKQVVRSRAQQPVRSRAKQQVRSRAQLAVIRARQAAQTRARQQARTRARQPVRSRGTQYAANTRARSAVRTRSRQPVLSREAQYAVNIRAAANRRAADIQARKAREQDNIRRVATAKWAAANRAKQSKRPSRVVRKAAYKRPTVRKAVYKRPVRRTIARIDPNIVFGNRLSSAAIERTTQRVRYDGKYVKIGYPWGDVPKSIGVCTDVVIRAYRRLGIDLQQEVHKDISQDFYAYPNLVKWGLRKPDPNIDHRRVYNLQAFFKRHKAELPRSRNPRHYKAGDLVTWMVGPNFPHIGVVVNKPSKADPNRLMIAHNIGYGPQVEDILFRFPMTGHYRYTPQNRKINPALLFAKTPPPASVIRRKQNSSLTYAEMLQASNILSGKVQARGLPNLADLLATNKQKARSQGRIMLAHLDATVFGDAKINQDALKALLK